MQAGRIAGVIDERDVVPLAPQCTGRQPSCAAMCATEQQHQQEYQQRRP